MTVFYGRRKRQKCFQFSGQFPHKSNLREKITFLFFGEMEESDVGAGFEYDFQYLIPVVAHEFMIPQDNLLDWPAGHDRPQRFPVVGEQKSTSLREQNETIDLAQNHPIQKFRN